MSKAQQRRLVRRRKNEVARASVQARTRFLATGGALTMAAAGLAGAPAQAALDPMTTTLVADIVPGVGDATIREITAVGSSVFFTHESASHGIELWKSDGTAAGTVLVKDIVPGVGSSAPYNLTAVSGTLFFVASDANGYELWKSDGTAAGTVLVKDINAGEGSYPLSLTAVGNTLFFQADDGVHGRELWKSNGTPGGTALVADSSVGASNSELSKLTAVAGTLFFTNTDTAGVELWSSDGTTMSRFADLQIGENGSYPDDLTSVGNRLFFTATESGSGRSIWAADPGDDSHTQLFPDTPSSVSDLMAVGNTLYFAQSGPEGNELWKSDGTVGGTALAADIRPGAAGSWPRNLTSVGGSLYFTADDGAAGSAGQLWRTTSAGATAKVKSWAPSPAAYAYPYSLTDVGGTLFFTLNDGISGEEVWRSDGTAAGTQVLDSRPGQYGSSPDYLTAAGGTLFFTARDGVHGRELWRTATAASPQPTPPATPPTTPTPPVTPPKPPIDSTVDGFSATAKGKQKQGKRVSIRVKVDAGEVVKGVAQGQIKVGRAKKRVKITAAQIDLAANGTVTLKVSVAKKASAAVIKAVHSWRSATKRAASKSAKKQARKKAVQATITVVVTDSSGNQATKKLLVDLV